MARKSIQYVEVAPCVPLGQRGQHAYTYYVSRKDAISIGSVVKIPFGKRIITGIVTVIDIQKPSYPTKQIRTITNIQLTLLQMQYARWLADMAHGGFGFTARLFLPSSFSGLASHIPPSLRQDFGRQARRKKPSAIIEHDADTRREMIAKLTRTRTGQTLILVPEVAMLTAYEKVFAKEIENNSAKIYHAGLSQSEKRQIWTLVDSGDCRIIVGTQKALFLPFQSLNTIIIDEEQIESYKLWDQYPRLHTVLGAEELARLAKASLIYSSSYPSLYLRRMISEKKCEVLRDNSIHPTAIIITSSFEDKKWKRKISDELGSNIRTWARSKKHVLIIFNKKDDAELKKSLFYKLSKSAKQHIYVGTVGMLTYPPRAQFDYVVWLFPEWTLRSIDYRSSERAKIIVSRLALLVASHDVYIGTRYGDVAKEVFGIKDEEWINKIFAERKRFNLPPYTQLVRLTMRDKTNAKAYARAEAIRTLIEESSGSHIAYGPYQELGAKKKLVHEYHVLLAGELQKLVEIYKELPIDAADVAPYRIV